MKSIFVFILSVGLVTSAQEQSYIWVKGVQANGMAEKRIDAACSDAQPLRLPAETRRLQFNMVVSEQARKEAARIQHRLDGVDGDWRELSGNMRLTLFLFDGRRNITQLYDFNAGGRSPGWTGRWSDSPLVKRSENFRVPEETEVLHVQLVSGGSIAAVGMMAIDDLRITVPRTGEVLFADDFEKGRNLDSAEGCPSGWEKGGLHRGILRTLSTSGAGTTNHLIGVVDSNVLSYAEWRYDLKLDGRKYAKETLNIAWKEVYTVGFCSSGGMNYEYVPPGKHLFRVRAVSPLGEIVKQEVRVAFKVPLVFWKRTEFLVASIVLGCLIVSLVVWKISRARWKRRLDLAERQRLIETERTRIARDIHDEVGTNLTRIGLLAQSISEESDVHAAETADEIGRTSRMLVQTLSEIVWMVNPHYDNVEGLVNYIGRFASRFLADAKIRCRLDLPADIAPQKMGAEDRRQIFLVVKEALNNVVRHAAASGVNLSVTIDNDALTLLIEDDGCGFDAIRGERIGLGGNGLANMKSRMESLGGTFQIFSQPEKGSTVRFTIPNKQGGVK